MLSVFAGIILLGGIICFSQEGTVQSNSAFEQILQSELKQQQIRATTQRVSSQLGMIIEEFERNGISGEDIQVLKSVQAVLGELSDKEMARIVDLLKQARLIQDYTASQTRMLEAFSTQKSIIVKLKQLLDEFKKQQALYELSIAFTRLADRQNANLKESVLLEPLIQGRSIDRLTEAQKIPLQVQATEQEFIKEETLHNISKVETLSKEPATVDSTKKALEIVANSNLKNTLQNAIEDLKNAKLYSAIGNEKKIRDTLREIARELIPSNDIAENLRRTLKELEALISEQKEIVRQTEELKKNNKNQDNNKEIAARQLDLSDRADSLKEQIKNSVPDAASDLKNSINQMQEAHAILNSNEGRWRAADALAREKDSLNKLEQAKNEVEKQLASALSDSQKPMDNLAQLKDLLNRVDNLIQNQTNLSNTAADFEKTKQISKLSGEATKKQQELKQQTRAAQTEAAPLAPAAAEELGFAAEQMAKSEQALSRGKNEPASQQAAVDALKRASNELKKTYGELQQAAANLAASEESLKKLSDVIKDQQQLNKETAKAAERQKRSEPVDTKPLARNQSETANKAKALQEKLSPVSPEAVQPVQNAVQNMQTAGTRLEQNNPQTARQPQADALDNLYKAKKAMEDRVNDLKQQLGMPSQSPSELAQAQEQIDNAQQHINDAISDLAPASFIDQLAQRQQAVAKKLATHNQKSQAKSAQIDNAHKEAAKAAENLARGNIKEAIGSMKQAEEAMKNAISQQQPESNQSSNSTAQNKGGEKNSGENSYASKSASERNNGQDNGNLAKATQTPSHQQPQTTQPAQNSAQPRMNSQQQSPDAIQPQAGQPETIPQLYEEQKEIREVAQQFLDTMQTPLEESIARAAQRLNSASAVIGNLAATATGLPPAAQSSVQQASSALSDAAAQTAAKSSSPALKNATAAQSALAQASAALSMAKAAAGSQKMAATNQNDGKSQGQGEGQNQAQSGNAMQSQNGQPGNGKQGEETGMSASQQRTAGSAGRSQGNSGNWYGAGGDKGQRMNTQGASRFIGLPKRDRDAIMQSQAEKYPQDYASYIEQYMKNLSDESTK
ncbi:MAG: hypothetical protein ACP5T0_04100 [Verrucomicrobiia bacterium]